MDIIDEVQEDTQTVIVMVGNIGTGKSTTAEWLMQQYRGRKIVCICNDAITMMTGNGDYTRYQPALGQMYKEMFFGCLCTAIDAGASVICDNSHMTKVSRAKIIEIAKESGLTCTCVDLGPGTPESLKRRQDANDGRGTPNAVWNTVHNRMQEKYQAPSTAEGFDCVITTEELKEIIDA